MATLAAGVLSVPLSKPLALGGDMQERDIDDDTGCGGYAPQSEVAVNLWIAATRQYAADCITAANNRYNADGGQALRDLRSADQRFLKTLCEPLGADVEAISRAIKKAVASNYGAGLHPKKSRPQKRKPKRQPKAA